MRPPEERQIMVGKLLFSPDADTLLKDVENSPHNKWVLIIVTTTTNFLFDIQCMAFVYFSTEVDC